MTQTRYPTLLLTGAAGALGRVLRPRLSGLCQRLRLSDRQPLDAAASHEELHEGDLADAAFMHTLLQGVDAVVHLGGISVEGPFEPILQANIVGLHNLYEAARVHGVKRVVYASSNHVTGFYPRDQVIDPSAPPRPDGMYGVSKAFGESLSRFYFDRYGIETACLRIGSCYAQPKDRRMLSTWLSFDDLLQLIAACLRTPVLGHQIIYGVSDNTQTWWRQSADLPVAFAPQDNAQAFAADVLARTPEPDLADPAYQFQGGPFVTAGPF